MFTHNKTLGQHFLTDKAVVQGFIDVARINKDDTVVEIGPGQGVLSVLIAERCRRLICMELDQRLEPSLKDLQYRFKNVELMFGNVLDGHIPDCDKIISSLPFSITEPFIHKLLKCSFNEAILLTGNRFATGVVNLETNKLSLLTNSFFTVKKYAEIPPNAFEPKPRVKSAIIRLVPRSYEDIPEKWLLIYRYLYNLRQKKLKNALVDSAIRLDAQQGEPLTQRHCKQFIAALALSDDLLEKSLESCSNNDIAILAERLQSVDW